MHDLKETFFAVALATMLLLTVIGSGFVSTNGIPDLEDDLNEGVKRRRNEHSK